MQDQPDPLSGTRDMENIIDMCMASYFAPEPVFDQLSRWGYPLLSSPPMRSSASSMTTELPRMTWLIASQRVECKGKGP